MDVEIGSTAGEVYRFIEANGPVTLSQLKKGVGRKDSLVNQALGWLAREDKVVRDSSGKSIRWTVNTC